MTQKSPQDYVKYMMFAVLAILLLRFILTGAIPLLDKTEARYAEIARIMAETNEWVVPQIDYGVPFWAKPPLSTWLSALSFSVFGVSEISARLPYFLLNIGLLLILGRFIKPLNRSFYLPAFILLTTPEFLIHTGVVSTDTALCFSVALIMLSFWKAITEERKSVWAFLFFVGVGLGLLAKGPLVLVLTGPPIVLWLFVHRVQLKTLLRRIPWILGILITALIAIPWYILAESRSPGFIDYFIVGEHFKRFLDSGWEGDLYGSGHSQPRGMIWVFLLLFAFPWIQIVLYQLWNQRHSLLKDRWLSFLMFWLLWTPAFFTLSGNILHTYILPVMVPMALLLVHWWGTFKNRRALIMFGSIFPALVLAGTLALGTGDWWFDRMNSDKYLLGDNTITGDVADQPLYYWKLKNHSGQFYSEGRAMTILDSTAIEGVIEKHDSFYLVVLKKRYANLPEPLKSRLTPVDSNYKTSLYLWEK